MVFETIKLEWMEHKPVVILIFGFIYSFLGYLIARLFFGSNVSIAMLFLTTLFAVPSLIMILDIGESRESTDGLQHFIQDHKDIIKVYLLLFLGIFLGYLLLGLISSDVAATFDFQIKFLERQEGLSGQLIDQFVSKPFEPSFFNVLSILKNNLIVSVISFLLSIFYGAGAVFLLVLNASIFSSFVGYVIQQLARSPLDKVLVLLFFFIHLIPEILGFMAAAIAGGILSKAILTEKPFSAAFNNVVKDASVLLFLSIGFIIIGALLEVFVTAPLFNYYF